MEIMILRIIAVILSMLVFLGICVWAFQRHSKARFEEAAHIPFLEEDLPSQATKIDRKVP
jgi:cytochrome c oxidase cbb3-type subunit 4